jgi:conjugal transfer/entry exclusion protein
MFQGIDNQIHYSLKKPTKNWSTMLNHQGSIIKLQNYPNLITTSNISVTGMVEVMNRLLKTLPTKKHLKGHTKAMDEALAKLQEVSTMRGSPLTVSR